MAALGSIGTGGTLMRIISGSPLLPPAGGVAGTLMRIVPGVPTAVYAGAVPTAALSAAGLIQPPLLRTIVAVEGTQHVLGAADAAFGNPLPSIRLDAKGFWRTRWVVRAGTRTVKVDCLQAVNSSPRPTITVKANPAIGVAADVSATAGSNTGWITIGPVTITPSSNGVVWIEIRANYDTQAGGCPCWFDNMVWT